MLGSMAVEPSLKKRVRGWMMFDSATQPFYQEQVEGSNPVWVTTIT